MEPYKREMEEVKECPICSNKEFDLYLDCTDYTVSKKQFKIVKCNTCGFKFTNPRPNEDELGRYYQSEEYISHSNTKKGIISRLYQTIRNYTLTKKLQLIEKFSSKGKILDIGCGTGEFLNTCKKAGWDTIGIEPSEQAREMGISNYNLSIYPENKLQALEKQQFDIITMWHVLEHVPHLNKRVEELKNLLKPEGTIIIAVPNPESKDANHYGKYWAAWDVPRHLYHFRAKDVIALFKKYGMECKKILPMKFDSYYVSLLSEKYKTGKVSLIKGFINGFLSNFNAKKGGFSSQIYIFKK